jgi:aminoglycoside phosphotransferase (APT) family kinase protein
MDAEALGRLQAYIDAQVPAIGHLREARNFSGGQSNPTYLLDGDCRRCVLRRKPAGVTLPSAHAIDREYRLLTALADTEVPVAGTLAYCDDPAVIGSEFYLMEFVDGVVHWDAALPGHEPCRRRPVVFAMTDTLAALHKVDWARAGLSDFGRTDGFATRQIGRWKRQYHASRSTADAGIERLLGWLETHVPAEDDSVTLVHGDYRIDNLMYHRDGAEVAAVLDWELSTLGHPLSDLAYLLLHHRLSNDGVFKGLGGVDRAGHNLPSEAEIIDRYCARTGRHAPLHLTFWIALSAFRLVAILEGVNARIRQGNAANPDRGRELVSAIPELTGLALNEVSATA